MRKIKQKSTIQNSLGYINSIQNTKYGLFYVDNDHLYFMPKDSTVSVRLFPDLISQLQSSPDEEWLSFLMMDDIHIYNIKDNQLTRLTYKENLRFSNLEWDDNEHLFFSLQERIKGTYQIYRANIYTKETKLFLDSDCSKITKSASSRYVLQERGYGLPASWREYQGGAVARLLELKNNGDAVVLDMPAELAKYNCHSPKFVGDRLFFIGVDQRGIGNIYEYIFHLKSAVQKTYHEDFYVTYFTKANNSIMYVCGNAIYQLSLEFENLEPQMIIVAHKHYKDENETKIYLRDFNKFITSCGVNDEGSTINLAVRGHCIISRLWSGAHEKITNSIRYMHSAFIDDTNVVNIKNIFTENKQMLASFEIYNTFTAVTLNQFNADIGFIKNISNVRNNKILCQNHIGELYCINLQTYEYHMICKPMQQEMGDFDISPDGEWITYSASGDHQPIVNKKYHSIYLYHLNTKTVYQITKNNYSNYNPQFSCDGRYVTFICDQNYNSQYDAIYFNIYFDNPEVIKAFAMHDSYPNPFDLSHPCYLCSHKNKDEINLAPNIHLNPSPVIFSLDIPNEKTKLTSVKLINQTQLMVISDNSQSRSIHLVNIESKKINKIADKVQNYGLSNNSKHIIVVMDNQIKIAQTGEDICTKTCDTFRNGGELKLNPLLINLHDEYINIFNEAWWFMKERFWSKQELENINWDNVYQKYFDRLTNIHTRTGVNKLIGEMFGEVRTSHAYIMNPGYVDHVEHTMGYLGIACVNINNKCVIEDILEVSDSNIRSSLKGQCQKGDIILSINGHRLKDNDILDAYMENTANTPVYVGYLRDGVAQRTLAYPMSRWQINYAIYKKWISDNKKYISDKTQDRVGYIHIPDMVSSGFREFHIMYAEAQHKDAIIVDLRYNSGGHTSSLIFKILSNVRTAKDIAPNYMNHFPHDAHAGKLIFLCNHSTGSDGDIATHHAKKLGYTVIGVRTWGGVVGINVRDILVDGGMFSFPEHSLHFNDNAKIENYGVEPTINVENTIQGYKVIDNQLDKAIEVANAVLAKNGK